MKTKNRKELMPLDMVRALMIEKGAKTLKDWEDISIEYNKNSIEYYIPTFSANTKRKYNKTINEILVEKKKNSKPILEIERALDYMRSSGVTNQNLWNLKAKDYNNNISNKYRIPDSSQVHKYYGKTIRELLIGEKALRPDKKIISKEDLNNIIDASPGHIKTGNKKQRIII